MACNRTAAAEYDASGQAIVEYAYMEGEPIAQFHYSGSTQTPYYVHPSHLGTPEQLRDASPTVVWENRTTPFGEAYSETGSVTQLARFPGQRLDEGSGLHYNWHRYYDPSLERYISADPIGQIAGPNLYTYAGNNPTNQSDPLGLYTLKLGNYGAAGAGVGGQSQAALAVDTSGDVGLVLTQSAGLVGGAAGSVGLVGGISTAPTIFDEAGASGIIGASGGALGDVGVDLFGFYDRAGNAQGAIEAQIGLGLGAEGHLQAAATTVIPLFNIPDALSGLLNGLLGLFGGEEDCP